MIDWNKPVQTRCGRPFRLYAKDGAPPYNIHGAYQDETGGWISATWDEGPLCGANSSLDPLELINVPCSYTFWVFLIRTEGKIEPRSCSTRADAFKWIESYGPRFVAGPFELTVEY